MAETFSPIWGLSKFTDQFVGWGNGYRSTIDILDGNLGKIIADATQDVEDVGNLDQTCDGVSADVDTTAHKLYGRHSRLAHNMASDANYSLATGEQRYAIIAITDTAPVLTTGRQIIVPTEVRIWWFENLTAQTLTVKTSAGSGVAVPATNRVLLSCNGTNVVALTGGGGGGGGGDMDASTYDPAAIGEQLVGISAAQRITGKKIGYGDVTVSSNTTLSTTHDSAYVYVTNGSTLLIPTNASDPLPVGYECWIIRTGSSNVLIDPDTGVTLNGGTSTLAIATQWAGAHLRKTATDTWIIVGAA